MGWPALVLLGAASSARSSTGSTRGRLAESAGRGRAAVTVPPGGAAVADLWLDLPGSYVIVDHALSRLGRGLAGHPIADGDDNPAVYRPP